MDITLQEQRSVLTICLTAAFADGAKSDPEREQIRKIADSLGPESPVDVPSLYQEVLLHKRGLEDAVPALGPKATRQFAYEMAVCVCNADGETTQPEKEFLERLRGMLNLEPEPSRAFAQQAGQLAATPLQAAQVNVAELEKSVMNYSILNGALELLPQTLASMAILPLQTKMVYGIGKAYGYELDRTHIMEFAATLGIGYAGQYIEQMGRKLVKGLLGRLGGGLLGGIGGAATGSAFSFATTYALGHVAIQYYSGGRSLDMQTLQRAFQSMFEKGKALQSAHSGDILQKARSIDVNQISDLVRRM